MVSSSKPAFRRRFVGCCGPLDVVVDGSTDVVDGSADVVVTMEITVDSAVGRIDSLMVSVVLVDRAEETEETILGFDLLRAGLDSTTGWVRVRGQVASPSTIRGIGRHELNKGLEEIPGSLISRSTMISLSSDTTIRQAQDILNNMQLSPDDEDLRCGRGAVVAVLEKGDLVGVLEVGSILDFRTEGPISR